MIKNLARMGIIKKIGKHEGNEPEDIYEDTRLYTTSREKKVFKKTQDLP